MNNKPKVSVIMPSLNVVTYIKECMDSVIQQTLKEIEIICVDAGSTDGTLETLQEYAEKDSRIQVIVSDKKSYGYQMNLGMDASSGEYMGIVETDDYILPEMYEELYEIASKNDMDFVKSDFKRFCHSLDELTSQEKTKYTKESNHLFIKYEKLLPLNQKGKYGNILNPYEDISLFKAPLNIWSGIYSFSFLKEQKIRFNETPGASYQDNGFYFQTFSLATKIMLLDTAFYMNRRDNPFSSVHDKGKVYCMNEEFSFIRNFLKEQGELEQHFLPIYCFKKYHNYMFTLDRVDDKFKFAYLGRFQEEFLEHFEKGEIDFTLFTEKGASELNMVIHEPWKYYNHEILKIQQKNSEKKVEIQKAMIDEKSYKIGRTITFIPRKLKGLSLCLQENGVRYTVKRIMSKSKRLG